MAIFKGVYRNFELSVQYVEHRDIPKRCPCCYVNTTLDGENLPNPVQLAEVYGDAYECYLVFFVPGYYQGQAVKISLKSIVEKPSRQCQKARGTTYISDNETVRMCLFPGQDKELVACLKFIVSGYKVEMEVVGGASKKKAPTWGRGSK